MVSPAEVLEYLHGMDFPAGKADVVKHALGRNAPEAVMDMLARMPDQQFRWAPDIIIAVGQVE